MSILLQGSTNYNGMDVAFVVSQKTEKSIDVQISFINGSKKAENNFSFKQVKGQKNKWKLDRSKHESDIDVYFETDKENIILSASEPDIKMFYNTKNHDLFLLNGRGKKIFDFLHHNAFLLGDNYMNIDFDEFFRESSFLEKMMLGFMGIKNDVNDAFNDLKHKTFKDNKISNDMFTSVDKSDLVSKLLLDSKLMQDPKIAQLYEFKQISINKDLMQKVNSLNTKSRQALLPIYTLSYGKYVDKLNKKKVGKFVSMVSKNDKGKSSRLWTR